jgi:quercetin dioxygenase-like cupin family protein
MKKKLLVLVALIGLAGSALAQDAMKATRVKPDELTWKANPALPPGSQFAILMGDPTKSEVVVQRVKFPPNYQIPPHTHPYAEVVTVLSGSMGFGMGEKFDTTKGEMVPLGTVNVVPVRHAHFGWTGNEGAILQIQYAGPGGIDYINPADDPRKKSQ